MASAFHSQQGERPEWTFTNGIFSPLPTYTWLALGILLLLLHAATNYFHHGLNQYPGPFLASLTNWWRFFLVSGQKCQETHIKLHNQLGNIVRLGPNCLSFADPHAAKTIYSLKNNLNKSTFYPVQMQLHRGLPLPSLFGTLDTTYHSKLRRLATPAFSMSNLVTHYEPRVDNAIKAFLSQTAKLYAFSPSTSASASGDGKNCNFVRWLQFFAFDVIAEITYSKRLGFIDREEDIDGIIESLDKAFDYSAVVGQMPWLDRWVGKQNPVKRMLSRWGVWQSTSATARFARERMVERVAEIERRKEERQEKGSEMEKEEAKGREEGDDLMGMFLQGQRDDHQQGSGFMTDHVVLTMATTMVLAGSDTTAASLAAVFYYLLRNEGCYRRLVGEIDDAVAKGVLSTEGNDGVVSWADAQKLPYLDACIKEAFRLHPAVGMHLERATSPGGMEICGEFVPGGTIVGCNAWVVHRSRDIFGEDVDEYRPERWLVDEELDQQTEKQRLSEMNATLLHFGAGTRACIGRNIALLEMYKFVPSFLRRFDIHPTTGKEWPLKNMWFIKPVEFDVKITARGLQGDEGKSLPIDGRSMVSVESRSNFGSGIQG